MNRAFAWLFGTFSAGLVLGAMLAGDDTAIEASSSDAAWSVPEEAFAPRHDENTFAEAFEVLRWDGGTADSSTPTDSGLPTWRLLGVVAFGDQPRALLMSTGGGPLVRVAEGAQLSGGVTLVRINGTQVTLRDPQGCTLTLSMPAGQNVPVRCSP